MENLVTTIVAAAMDKGVDFSKHWPDAYRLPPCELSKRILNEVRTAHSRELLIKDGYRPVRPCLDGKYSMTCYELGYEVSQSVIEVKNGIAHCPDLGSVDLETYHDGLTGPLWRRI